MAGKDTDLVRRSEPKKSPKLRKRLSFQTTAGSIKRKADLFELPTYAKNVKTGGERDSTSSLENLLGEALSSSPVM